MTYQLNKYEDFERIFKARQESNELLVSMGQPIQQFSQEEMLRYMELANERLSNPYNSKKNTQHNKGEFDDLIMKDPKLQTFLTQNIKVIEEYSKIDSTEFYYMSSNWSKIFKILSRQTEHKYSYNFEKEIEEIKKLYEQHSIKTPYFQEFLLLLGNFEFKHNLAENLLLPENILSFYEYNPLKSSVSKTCEAVSSTFAFFNKYLHLEAAKKLDNLGFNFDWMIAFSPKDSSDPLFNSMPYQLLSVMAIKNKNGKPIIPEAKEYMTLIFQNSTLFQNRSFFESFVERVKWENKKNNSYRLPIEEVVPIYEEWQIKNEKKLLSLTIPSITRHETGILPKVLKV